MMPDKSMNKKGILSSPSRTIKNSSTFGKTQMPICRMIDAKARLAKLRTSVDKLIDFSIATAAADADPGQNSGLGASWLFWSESNSVVTNRTAEPNRQIGVNLVNLI